MAIMSDNAPPGQRGVAMGLRTQANQAASMTAPITTGALVPALGINLGFAASAIFLWGILGIAMALHFLRWPRQRQQAYEQP
jgi:MFS family permease